MIAVERPAARRERAVAWGIALALHLLFMLPMIWARRDWGASAPRLNVPGEQRVALRLVPPPEEERGTPMVAALTGQGEMAPEQEGNQDEHDARLPVGQEGVPVRNEPQDGIRADPPSEAPPPPEVPARIDEETRRELDLERERALAAVAQLREAAEAEADRVLGKAREQMRAEELRDPLSATIQAPNGSGTAGVGGSKPRGGGPGMGVAPVPRPVPVGTIRELDLSGMSDDAQQVVMKRYGMRITTKAMAGGVPQSFLSAASTASGGRFLSGAPASQQDDGPGIFEVFLLSPRAVAHMSRLEEGELQRRGLDPLRTRVTRVKFGLVGTEQEPDLGVTLFQAEPVE